MSTNYASTILATAQKAVQDSFPQLIARQNALLHGVYNKCGFKGSVGPLLRADLNPYGATVSRINGGDIFPIVGGQTVIAATVSPREIVVTEALFSRDMNLNNAGDAQIEDLMSTKIEKVMNTAAITIGGDAYSTGAITNQMPGIEYMFTPYNAGNPATVFGISQANAWWRPQIASAAVTATDPQTIASVISNIKLACMTQGKAKIDMAYAGNYAYTRVESSLVNGQRWIDDTSNGSLGIDGVRIAGGVQLMSDPGQAPDATLYLLSSEALIWQYFASGGKKPDSDSAPNIIELKMIELLNQMGTGIIAYTMNGFISNNLSALGKITFA